ncbi:MAG: hypothetical protein ACW967_10245 [Candidatus Hodarchaeales archaeon]|jgi:hypothetical protein
MDREIIREYEIGPENRLCIIAFSNFSYLDLFNSRYSLPKNKYYGLLVITKLIGVSEAIIEIVSPDRNTSLENKFKKYIEDFSKTNDFIVKDLPNDPNTKISKRDIKKRAPDFTGSFNQN